MRSILTIGIICQELQILLGLKLKGFGVGLWNGPGGHFEVEIDKSVEASFKREAFEEAALTIGRVEQVGYIDFQFADKPGSVFETQIFKVHEYWGQPRDGEEMRWNWFGQKEIPYDKMWPADILWLPQILAGRKIRGWVIYDNKETRQIVKQRFWGVKDF